MDESKTYNLESEQSFKRVPRKSGRLIQKICEMGPLFCPKCATQLSVISVRGRGCHKEDPLKTDLNFSQYNLFGAAVLEIIGITNGH